MKRWFGWIIVWLAAVLLPVKAAAAAPSAEVQTRTGEWAAFCSAMPGEKLHCRAELTLRTGEEWTVYAALLKGVEFLSLAEVSADGERVNASYYTLVTGERAGENAFALHLSKRFSERESVRLRVAWTVRLCDGCAVGTDGNGVFLTAESKNGDTAASGRAAVCVYGFSVFRGIRFSDTGISDHPLPSACFRLYYDAVAQRPVAFRECGGAYLACALECDHTRHTYILRTGENGYAHIEGLPAGTYYLRETRPPCGYESAAEALRVTISETGAMEAESGETLGNTLFLLETAQTAPAEDKTLAFYRRGCGVMVTLFAAAIFGKRYTFF